MAMQIHVDSNDFDYPIGATCDTCEHSFSIDPCLEENLVLIDHELFAKCPKCGRIDKEEYEKNTEN